MADYSSYTETELLHLLKAGNEGAFSEIYKRYWDKLFVVAANRLDSPEDAEECVQDVFVSIWRRRAELSLQYSMATYLSSAVRYQAINTLEQRQRQRRQQQEALQQFSPATAVPSAEYDYLAKEIMDRVQQTIRELPAQCRLVYQLSTEQGLSNPEIAENLGIAENTVKTHLKKANKDIRGSIDPLLIFLVIQWMLQHPH